MHRPFPTLFVFVVVTCSVARLFADEPDETPTFVLHPIGKLSAEEIKEGFVSLFDGKTLDGWQGATKTYKVENGVLVCKKHGEDERITNQNLFTTKQFDDFVLRFEYKLEPGGNNGVAVRTPLEGRPSRMGIEVQLLDDYAERYKNLAPHQYNGSIYLLAPAKRGHLNRAGEWNRAEIMFNGRHAKVTLNGEVIVDVNLDKLDYKKYLDLSKGRTRKRGYIGLLGHGSRVEFRNIRIKEL